MDCLTFNSYKFQFYTKVCASYLQGLSNSSQVHTYDGWAKYLKRVPDVSDPN